MNQELSAREFQKRMGEGLVVDVRETHELVTGKLAGSKNIPLSELSEDVLRENGPFFFYCSKGQRSLLAAEMFPGSYSLQGGLESWKREGLPFKSELSAAETHHYSRQILLPEISLAGQKRIRQGRVLLVGGGGLGSPASLYLAAAGIGQIGIVDNDAIESSNLPRQIIYHAEQEGQPKALGARDNLERLNPDTKVIPYKTRLDRDNVLQIIEGWDVILDGADNFPTRYLLNDAAKRLGIPLVSASILGFEGQISTFLPESACYRCIWPEPPPAEFAPSCSEAGILGTVSGTLGTLQANEALKIIASFGKTLANRLLLINLLDNSWNSLRIQQREDCPVCHGKAGELPDYEAFCALSDLAPAKAKEGRKREPMLQE